MTELIKLNPAEQFLANSNLRINLKEVADKYGKEHGRLVKSFELEISKLNDENYKTFNFAVASVSTANKSNSSKARVQVLKTYEMDIKTLVWFIAKFDANLRANIINYAFEKLEKDKQEAVIEAKKPKIYKDGTMSVRRCLMESFDDEDRPKESDIWDALVWKGFIITKAKATIERNIPDELEGFIGDSSGTRKIPTFAPEVIKKVWKEYSNAGKPVKSEYDRLVDEFAQISEYYNMRLNALKTIS